LGDLKLRKELVVLQITVVQGEPPSVALSMLEEKALRPADDEESSSYRQDLQYLLSTEAASRILLSYDEYVSSGIKVGDRVSISVTKVKDTSPGSLGKLLESKSRPPGRTR
jgi:hypothetical protein